MSRRKIVSIDLMGHNSKIDRECIRQAMQVQANAYGKTIRFCKFTFLEEIITIEPEKK